MIILDATTKSLQFKLGGSATTNQLPFTASYIDTTGTATTPGEEDGASNNTTAVTVVSAPASSTQRLVKSLIIQNADTAAATVTVIYNNNSTLRNVIVVTLSVGDQLLYEDGSGWLAMDKNGNLKTGAAGGVTSVSNSDGTLTISPTSGAVVASVATHGVANVNLAQMAANTIKGNNTGGTANAADLTVAQVLSMLNVTAVTYNSITGLLPTSISGTSTTASITITAGQAADSTNATMLSGGSFSWAVSNGNAINGYQGGTTLPNSSTIHFYICSGASGTGTFASTSLTPTLPSGYNSYYRRIFSLNTNSSGSLLGGTAIETEGGSLTYYLTTQVLDINNPANLTSASRVLYTLGSMPTGIKMHPLYRMTSASAVGIILTSPDEADVAPATGGWNWTAVPGNDWSDNGSVVTGTTRNSLLITNTSAQIGARATSGTTNTFYWVTRGWRDFRRS